MPKRKSITGDNSLVPIRKKEVPMYLRSGAFYQSLNEEEEEEVIMVPGNAVKEDPSVSSCADAIHLFESLRFWMVEEIPADFVKFALTQDAAPFSRLEKLFWKEFRYQFKWLQAIQKCVNATIKRKTTKMSHIVLAGNIELLQCSYDVLQCLPDDACELAIASGSVECLHFTWEHSWRPDLGKAPCDAAVSSCKDEKLLIAVHNLGAEWNADTCSVAARQGNLSCLQYLLHEQACPWRSDVCNAAALSGSLPCLQYAREHGCPWDENVCRDAARGGSLQCLQYALQHGCLYYDELCEVAARWGHLQCLQWLYEQGCCSLTAEACCNAALSGSIPCLQYAHEHCGVLDETVCEAAVRGGWLKCVQYVHEQGCPWSSAVCSSAASCGNLPILRYAHEHGCPWAEDTCAAAAIRGSLSCLQYAHEQGCPWSTQTCVRAAQSGHLGCLTYLHEQGCPWDAGTCRAAFERASLPCLQYAHEHGCPISDALVDEARRWGKYDYDTADEVQAHGRKLKCCEYIDPGWMLRRLQEDLTQLCQRRL